MHLRNAACRGAVYGTDQSAAAHDPHEFFPYPMLAAARCYGWTEDEAAATDLVERLRKYALEHPFEDGARLEASASVLAQLNRLVEPDAVDMHRAAGLPPLLDTLFGVPLVMVAASVEWGLRPGEWRLVAADRTVVDANSL